MNARAFAERGMNVLAWAAPILLVVMHFAHTVALRHLLTLIIMAALAATVCSWRDRPPPLLAPVAAWLGYTLLSVSWSVAPWGSLRAWSDEAFFPMLMFWVFFVLGADGRGEHRVRVAASAGMIGLAILSSAGYAEVSNESLRRGLLYFYPGLGQASTYAVLSLPMLLFFFLERTSRWGWLGVIGLFASAITGAVTLNKMLWPVAAVTLLCALTPRMRWTPRNALIAVFTVVLVIALGLAAAHRLRGPQLQGVVQPPATSVFAEIEDLLARDPRPALWRSWSRLALETPWLGTGFGKKLPAEYHRPRHPDDRILNDPYYGAHAHNLFLNTMLQTGVAGVVLLVWLLAALVQGYAARRVHQPTASWCGLALVLAMVLKNTTDDFMRDSMAMYFWALAGWLLARAQRGSARASS